MTSQAKPWYIAGLALTFVACAPTTATNVEVPSAFTGKPSVSKKKGPSGNVDDRAMCEWKGKSDREASEVAGPGSLKPNVRRVFMLVGTGEDQHRVLVCREIDTNFDGIKDVMRRYNEKGESVHEESDSNYDGRIDTWLTFTKGHLAETRIDNDRDGKPDEWKFYSEGRLSRIRRDTNRDGAPDIWEIYREGKLERMGVDIDNDGRVDRWDHDTELRRRFDEAERKKQEEAEKREAAAKEAAEKEADDSSPEKAPETKAEPPKGTPAEAAPQNKAAPDKSAAEKPTKP